MAAAVLVERQIEDGERIVKALEEDEIPIAAAFWLSRPESGDWRLVIATPLVDEKGLLFALSRLHSVRNAIDPEGRLRLYSLTAQSPKKEGIRGLIEEGRKHPEYYRGRYLSSRPYGRSYLEDIYVYRLN
jgi:hypothetical protein